MLHSRCAFGSLCICAMQNMLCYFNIYVACIQIIFYNTHIYNNKFDFICKDVVVAVQSINIRFAF